MVNFGAWCPRRGQIALLGEETELGRCVNLGCRPSWRIGSSSTTRRGGGREIKVDGIGKKTAYGLQLAIMLHIDCGKWDS
jgi:hypothetical protein